MELIERLPNDEFLPTRKLPFVDVFGLMPIFEQIAFTSNIILVGPKGIAKSMAFAHYAYEKKRHIVTFDCSEDVRRAHLIGAPLLRGHESPFVLGPIPTAYEIANETGHCILCLEEINALSPQMQKVLNSTTDFRRRIEVPEAKKVFELKGNAKLWVVGSMNTAGYGGVYQLNEDLKSRMRMLPLPYPTNEGDIVASEMRHRNLTVDPDTVKKVMTLATETRQRTSDYALSPRDVVQIIEDISLTKDIKTALWIASGKFDDGDRSWFQNRVWEIFNNILLPGATPPSQTTRPATAPTQQTQPTR